MALQEGIENHGNRTIETAGRLPTPQEDAGAPRPLNPKSTPESIADKFSPYDLSYAPNCMSGLPEELWDIVQSVPANFLPQYFLEVSRSLLENPNLTASHLARAELSYQSFTDATFNPKARVSEELASIIKHLRPDCRPRLIEGGIEGYELEYTVVRKLIARNPKLDDSLMQTCHLFVSHEEVTITTPEGKEETVQAERYMVIYIPHVSTPEEIPHYHPKVQSLAMLYTFLPSHDSSTSLFPSPGLLSIYYTLFPSQPLDTRLSRTALKLLEIIHKHSRGRAAGYQKRVHHDQIIGQKSFQDTYAYLKGKYAKELIERWVEQTPPEKHVFEDLGIAAFLIELWVDMYGAKPATNGEGQQEEHEEEKRNAAQASFPGFVDIGCGNGLLVHILNLEGWHGWGFDARRRKTWDTFPPQHTEKLKEMLLVPKILQPTDDGKNGEDSSGHIPHHNGVFPPATFIISNHADELTPWTSLLAYISSSPFIAIPCCSHDFGGTRFRAPSHSKHIIPDPLTASSKKPKQPSAYASLCSWVCHLTESTGYKVEKEYLRIPSTRNIAVVGRTSAKEGEEENRLGERLGEMRELVEKEMGGVSVGQVFGMWMKSGDGLLKPGKGGH
jgi:tRNASer (uridine44-2'-O)-methyltransferase